MGLQEHYANRETCLRELGQAREVMGNRNTTMKQADGVMKGLGFMLLYCPPDLVTAVEAHIIDWENRIRIGSRIGWPRID